MHWFPLDSIPSGNRTKKKDWVNTTYKGECMTQWNGKFISVNCRKRAKSVCQKPKLGKYAIISH